MPYEATVPVHRRLLWPAVIDPERLLGALPNAVIDASGNQGVAGRLRVRMREQTVTFRGIARIIEVIPTSLRVTLEVEATFGRSGGAIEGVVEITLRPAGSGTRAVVGGSLRLTDDSSPLPPGDAVDAALGRIVRRWFAALAESSPTGGRADLPEAPPAVPEPARAPERAPLAVVRDVPSQDSAAVGAAAVANAKDPDPDPDPDPEIGKTGGDNAESGESKEVEIVGTSPDSDSGSDSNPDSGIDQGEAKRVEPSATKSVAPQVQLRLVSSREDVSPESDEGPEYGAGGGTEPWIHSARRDEDPDQPGLPSDLDQGPDSSMDAAEDIWSRLRDRGLPRWIPVVVSAMLAALGTAVLFIVTMRRRHRRHHG